MKKSALPLIAAACLLCACSTTSNDLTQAVAKRPDNATSYQCESGYRLFAVQTPEQKKDGSLDIIRAGKTISLKAAKDRPERFENETAAFETNQYGASLYERKDGKDTIETERCMKVPE